MTDHVDQALSHLRSALARISQEELDSLEVGLVEDKYVPAVIADVVHAARVTLEALAEEKLAAIETRLRYGPRELQ